TDAEGRGREQRAKGSDDERYSEEPATSQELPSERSGMRRLAPDRRPDDDPGAPHHVVPVAELARLGRRQLVDRVEEAPVAHGVSSGSDSRSAACALCSVAETVPRATPSTAAISS